MKRETLLAHIDKTLGEHFARAELVVSDEPETLFHVLNEALQYETDSDQRRVAVRETKQLLIDRADMLGRDLPSFAKGKSKADEKEEGEVIADGSVK